MYIFRYWQLSIYTLFLKRAWQKRTRGATRGDDQSA